MELLEDYLETTKGTSSGLFLDMLCTIKGLLANHLMTTLSPFIDHSVMPLALLGNQLATFFNHMFPNMSVLI